MKHTSYRDPDFAFGQMMLNLRSAIGLTQAGLADYLGVSRRSVVDWEAGNKYPKPDHLRKLIRLAMRERTFTSGSEAEEIRALWKAARQKVLIDETWLADLLAPVANSLSPSGVPISIKADMGMGLRREKPTQRISLPLQSTPFVGRDAELKEITRILHDPACRLLTLLGPGGIGKTRLALKVAAAESVTFADGVTFVALAPISTPNQIVSAIGEALILTFSGQTDPRTDLFNYLHERQMLLVLDNFEHLLDGVDVVYDLMQHVPHVTLLITSQVRLGFQAEWLFDVEGLAYPRADKQGVISSQSLLALTKYDAVQLFVQRARQVQPEFAVSESTLITIGRICRQVMGMPLAIELAAASVRTHSIEAIEQQIQMNLDALSTNLRDVLPRHRSMRAVFDHSWNLLNEPERVLLSRLAVFRGSFSAEAAEQTAGATLRGLQTLVDKSLLRYVSGAEESQASIEVRFLMLEPLRDYALEKLTARRELESVQRAHAHYYLTIAQTTSADEERPGKDSAFKQLDQEYDNLRAAITWAGDSGAITLGFQLGVALLRFWRRRGYYSEGRTLLAGLLEMDDAQVDKAALSARLSAIQAAAWLASDQHDFEQAARLYEQSATLRHILGESEDEATRLSNIARQARAVGEYPRATALFEEAVAHWRAQGDHRSAGAGGLGNTLYELALVLREQSEFARASALLEEFLELHREIDDQEGTAQGLLAFGDVARDQGDAAATRKYTEASLVTYRETGTQWAIGFALNNLALADYMEGNLPRAFDLASESLALFQSIQNDGARAEVLVTLGHIQAALGNLPAAREALMDAFHLAETLGPRLLMAAALEGLGSVLVSEYPVLSVQLISAASAMRVEMGTPVRPADQPDLERALKAARLRLGNETFDILWSGAKEQPTDELLSAIPKASLPNVRVPAQVHPATQPIVQLDHSLHDTASNERRIDWGDAPLVSAFYGREQELTMLSEMVIDERCQVVGILGMGGLGKSSLAVRLTQQVVGQFDFVIWRSLRDAPDCDAILDSFLQIFNLQATEQVPKTFEERLHLLTSYLRGARILLVLDNLEVLLEEGANAGQFRSGYENYGRLLRHLAATEHQSCLLITSREKPADLIPYEGNQSRVRVLRLTPLDRTSCTQLLTEKNLTGSLSVQAQLIEAYGGNPLALKIVAQTISDLFGGEIAPFLQEGEVIFGGVRKLLSEQFARLSRLEQEVLIWLAILREPTTISELLSVLVRPVMRGRLLDSIEALSRRSLIERGQKSGSFTLQSVVLEYVTARLIVDAVEAILSGNLEPLLEHGFERAYAHEYVRQTQVRLLLAPILAQLHTRYPNATILEAQLLALLQQMAALEEYAQGYGPANLVALMCLERGHLRSLNLSRLMLRGLYLQGVDMQDASLAGSTIWDSVFSENFVGLTAVAICSTDEFWAAASSRGEIHLWTAEGQKVHRAWRAHTGMVFHLAFSPDGRTLASGGWDGEVKVWDVDMGALLWSGRHSSHVNNVAFSPDGHVLASSGNDAVVHLWDSYSGIKLQTLPHPAQACGDGRVWSPDGRLLACGDSDGYIHIWALSVTEPAVCIQVFKAHSQWIDGLAFSPDGLTLASASFDGTVKLWNVVDGRLLEILTGHTNRVHRLAWSPDGRILASSSFDQTVCLWDVDEGSYRAKLRGHTAAVGSLAFTPDGESLLTGSEDGTMRLWNVANGQCLRTVQGYVETVYDIAWSPDDSRLVSGGSDFRATVYDVTGKLPPQVQQERIGIVIQIGWSSSGRWIASGEWDNIVRLWDPVSGRVFDVLHHPDDSGNFFEGLAWSPDGLLLACATYAHGVQVFDLMARGYPSVNYPAPTRIRRVAWNPDGSEVAGGGADGIVYIWDVVGKNALCQHLVGHEGSIWPLAWSPDGVLIASSSQSMGNSDLFVWDVALGQPLMRSFVQPSHVVSSLAWGLNSEYLVSGDNNGILSWWDVKRGEVLWHQQAHQGTVHALKRSSDGTKLASCGGDGVIQLWDLASGRHLQTLRRDRPYERLNITGIRGLNEAQKATLVALGAIEDDIEQHNLAVSNIIPFS